MSSKYLQQIFTQEMTRKEFLVYLGMFLVTITGVSNLFKNLSKINFSSKKTISFKENKSGFGSGPYGV